MEPNTAVQLGQLEKHLDAMVALADNLGGCLSPREVRFLALCAATLPAGLGEVLEIGSFKGKSTTILAKSVALNEGGRIVAVDPLTLPASTDPLLAPGESLPDIFEKTLQDNAVRDLVEFHQVRSEKLAEAWTRPLRFLWIDGDHTYSGTQRDFENFSNHLRRGAVVAFHDVLHLAEGPIRLFCEQVLLNPLFGPCGVCGSIGWAQYIGSGPSTNLYSKQKITLYRKLSRLIQFVALSRTPKATSPFKYRFLRPLVPHGEVEPRNWYWEISRNLPPSESNFELAAGVQ